jgi:alpha-N-arabinofuranosidase
MPALYAVASRREPSREVILKVVNVSDRPQETEVRLQGVRRLASRAKVITLTGDRPDAENSLEHPTRVAPVERTLEGVAPSFRYTFLPYSLTVMVLKER